MCLQILFQLTISCHYYAVHGNRAESFFVCVLELERARESFSDSHPFYHSTTPSYGENSAPQVQAVYLILYTNL